MLQTVYAYSGVRETPPVLVEDGMGGTVDVGHRVWIAGEGSKTWGVPPAREQELVLMDLVLEIGVCQTPYEPPPPEG